MHKRYIALFALFILYSCPLYCDALHDSVQTDSYQFVNMWSLQNQARLYSLQTTALHNSYTLLMNGTKVPSPYPPKKLSPSEFLFATARNADSLLVHTMPIETLEYVEMHGNQSYQFRYGSHYCLFTLVPAGMAALVLGGSGDNPHFMSVALLSFMYIIPPYFISGIGSSGSPNTFRCTGPDFFNTDKWNFDVGTFYGPLRLSSDDGLHHKNTYSYGFYANLQRSFSPFSYSLRIARIPLPPYENSLSPGDYELLINPALKTALLQNKVVRLHLLSGIAASISHLSETSDYPYEYDYLWGSAEFELQIYVTRHLVFNMSSAMQYSLDEHVRFPFYVGLSFTRARPSPRHIIRDN
jgi:hypothetical protein